MLTLSWYFDRRETSPTLVCMSPNRIPEKISNSVFRMDVSPVVIKCNILQLESQVLTHTVSLKILPFSIQVWDYDGLKKNVNTSDVFLN